MRTWSRKRLIGIARDVYSEREESSIVARVLIHYRSNMVDLEECVPNTRGRGVTEWTPTHKGRGIRGNHS